MSGSVGRPCLIGLPVVHPLRLLNRTVSSIRISRADQKRTF